MEVRVFAEGDLHRIRQLDRRVVAESLLLNIGRSARQCRKRAVEAGPQPPGR
jgi:hypothetical protein